MLDQGPPNCQCHLQRDATRLQWAPDLAPCGHLTKFPQRVETILDVHCWTDTSKGFLCPHWRTLFAIRACFSNRRCPGVQCAIAPRPSHPPLPEKTTEPSSALENLLAQWMLRHWSWSRPSLCAPLNVLQMAHRPKGPLAHRSGYWNDVVHFAKSGVANTRIAGLGGFEQMRFHPI